MRSVQQTDRPCTASHNGRRESTADDLYVDYLSVDALSVDDLSVDDISVDDLYVDDISNQYSHNKI